ncbi:hypothetical protein, conserved [Babesia ovata]|uniref:RNA-editing substrate-binding complex 6 protein domain-containing protein n=1 Tax=Babesia ovata TaxID=189622 RepID=A0A2H6KBQ1_9APIC|nr:uncharacterized protein BOVATA_019130 [Babesia ovata]GBE60420.1 hypothetical protein, conserved [Babesia ovata]
MSTVGRPIAAAVTDAAKLVTRIKNAAKYGETDVDIWRRYSKEVLDCAQKFDLPQVVNMLSSYSYMRYRHVGVLDALAARVCESSFKLKSGDIARVLRTYSMLEHRNEFMFRLMLPELSKRMDMFSLADLTSVFYSYANLGYYNRHFVSCVESAMVDNIQNVSCKELCHALSALGKLHVRLPRLETVLGCHFCTRVDLCTYTELALITNALGRLDFCGHPHLFSVVETEVYRKSKNLPPHSFALMANAISRREDSLKALDFMSKQMPDRLREFDVHSLCLLGAAFSRRGAVRREMFDRMAARVGRISLGLYPRAVASLSFSYGRAGHLHEPLMCFAGRHLERFLAHYSCNEVAMILRSHNLLTVRNEQLLLQLAKFICDNCPDIVPIRMSDPLARKRIAFAMGYDDESNEYEPRAEERSGSEFLAELFAETEDEDEDAESSGSTSRDDSEITHINHLEIVVSDPFGTHRGGKHFLERGLMHSLLWIAQSFAVHGVWNEGDVKGAMQRIASEVATRVQELTPLTTVHFMYAYARLNYRLDTFLDVLLRELRNPRVNVTFEQDELRTAFHALTAYGIDPASAGVYRLPSIEVKRLMEIHGNDVDRVVRDILTTDYETTEGVKEIIDLEIDVPFAEGAAKAAIDGEPAITYVHIPACVSAALAAGRPPGNFAERVKYNFTI